MIDPLTSLAFAIQSQPGVYACLIGSGVSRDAQIPTGWGITEQLVRQLAATRGAEIAGDPGNWYEDTFGVPVGFSTLLHELAPARTERQALLRQFIEPVADQPDERRPTAAHQALARLARSGHIRVFVTTNFDRLLEQALEAEGLAPLVVASSAAASGAAPFHHESVVVFKLHGDYLDPDSMLVTEDELAAYEPAVERRLNTVLEDYGLIGCGWSSEWDPALRSGIEAATARRYPLYLTGLSALPSETTQALLDARHGTLIEITGADSFFTTLERRVSAIDALNEPHPLDTAALVAAVKHALPRPERRIELEELVVGAAERVSVEFADPGRFPQFRDTDDLSLARAYVEQIAATAVAVRPAAEVLAACAAWGETRHVPVISRAMSQLSSGFDPSPGTFQDVLVGLRRLPALLCLYASGAAAIANANYAALKALAIDPKVVVDNGRVRLPLITQLNTHSVFTNRAFAEAAARSWGAPEPMADDRLQAILSGRGGGTYHAPVGELLARWVDDVAAPYVPAAERKANFDRVEVILDLLAIHEDSETDRYTMGGSFGRYANQRSGSVPEDQLIEEFEAQQEHWPPVAQGLFGGNAALAVEALRELSSQAASVRQQRFG